VRDGSDKVRGIGYGVSTVVWEQVDSSEITPLIHKLYSQNAKEFIGENRR
jgi:hypothetical protein